MAEQAELPVTTTQAETPVADTKPAAETKPATETTTAEPTAETKPAADTKPETKADEKPKDGKADEKTADAPVDYAKAMSEVKLPEGVTLDPVAAKAATELFGKHKVSPELAKELTSFYAAQQKAGAEGAAKAFSDQVGVWKAESEKSTTPEDRGIAKEAVTKAFDAKTIELMEHFGLMNHPGVLKGLAKIGKAIKDDSFLPGDAGSLNGSRDARTRFPNSNMNP